MARVLLVEDSEDILFILQIELSALGYNVDIAANAEEGIELARTNRPDVIVSDLHMPGLDGFEFIRLVREISGLANVPAIALTGLSLEREVERALESGFTAHLTKPVEVPDLARMIETLARTRSQRQAG